MAWLVAATVSNLNLLKLFSLPCCWKMNCNFLFTYCNKSLNKYFPHLDLYGIILYLFTKGFSKYYCILHKKREKQV